MKTYFRNKLKNKDMTQQEAMAHLCAVTGYSEGHLLTITSLDIEGCKGLTSLPPLPNLEWLNAKGCTGLTSLPPLPNLVTLNAEGCTGLTSLPPLPNLEWLNAEGCTGLTSLPPLPNLVTLYAEGCTGLTIVSGCGNNMRTIVAWDTGEHFVTSLGCFKGTEEECVNEIKKVYKGESAEDYIAKVRLAFQLAKKV